MTFLGIIVGLCKTGRNASHSSQNCWGHDGRNLLHPFDVKEYLGKKFWGILGRILGE